MLQYLSECISCGLFAARFVHVLPAHDMCNTEAGRQHGKLEAAAHSSPKIIKEEIKTNTQKPGSNIGAFSKKRQNRIPRRHAGISRRQVGATGCASASANVLSGYFFFCGLLSCTATAYDRRLRRRCRSIDGNSKRKSRNVYVRVHFLPPRRGTTIVKSCIGKIWPPISAPIRRCFA